MKVTALMSTEVVSVELDDSLKEIKSIFDEKGFHHLLVVESGKLLGIISDRDLFLSLSPKVGTNAASKSDLATLQKRAHQIMSHDPVTLKQDSLIQEAIKLFNQEDISCIPIVDNEKRPVGILSWRDIMRKLGELYQQS
ncbi:CBS domain-containing protein [Aliikangiella marina]|uniref:CBS domain-containing protein n=1 Tax=Aliikangiella marina TaxID=1712262 RepID=A0A545TE89_9GAMM|nr:CBS domain-containing protein [Aliikangiella marina]TQV75545.1 CBS domain-containing protein [Aliikangiella marina]